MLIILYSYKLYFQKYVEVVRYLYSGCNRLLTRYSPFSFTLIKHFLTLRIRKTLLHISGLCSPPTKALVCDDYMQVHIYPFNEVCVISSLHAF
jgi:hypothetical protein